MKAYHSLDDEDVRDSVEYSTIGPSNLQKLKHVSYSVPVISVREPTNLANTITGIDVKLGRQIAAGTRQKKFCSYFYPLKEQLLNYYACALTGDGLFQGHLYITQNHFAFYSHVLGFTRKVLIPVHKIDGIEKEYTAKIIPNAISISTQDKKHFFTSFLSREHAYRFMREIWEQKIGKPLDANCSQNEDESSSDQNCLKAGESFDRVSEESGKDSLEPESSPVYTTNNTPSTLIDEKKFDKVPARKGILRRMQHISQDIFSIRDSVGQIKEPVKRYSEHLIKLLLITVTLTLVASAIFLFFQISKLQEHGDTTNLKQEHLSQNSGVCQTQDDGSESFDNALKCVRDNIQKVKDVRQTLEDLTSIFDSK